MTGTLLVASGTGALNQSTERRFDAQNAPHNPAAAGGRRLKPLAVLWFGIALSVLGSVYLAVAVNLLACLLAFSTLLSYLFFYTALKSEVAAVHSSRSIFGGDAAPDWVDTLLRAVPLAVPALYVDRVDVPRGLCSCWLFGAAGSVSPFATAGLNGFRHESISRL